MGFFTMQDKGSVLWVVFESQSLSGWDGVFHTLGAKEGRRCCGLGRNPFQGGMGFFTSP